MASKRTSRSRSSFVTSIGGLPGSPTYQTNAPTSRRLPPFGDSFRLARALEPISDGTSCLRAGGPEYSSPTPRGHRRRGSLGTSGQLMWSYFDAPDGFEFSTY